MERGAVRTAGKSSRYEKVTYMSVRVICGRIGRPGVLGKPGGIGIPV